MYIGLQLVPSVTANLQLNYCAVPLKQLLQVLCSQSTAMPPFDQCDSGIGCMQIIIVLLQDAFPPNFVKQNRFQRQATLLVYLNDVQTGGRTHFDRLDVSIQPECGKALLFFPAFADGTPDPR